MIYKIIGILVILTWFFYVYTRQPKNDRVSFLVCLIGMAVGAFPVFFGAFFFQIYSSAYLLKLIPDTLWRIVFMNFVLIALSEEGLKFLASSFFVKKYSRKINYIVLFASVATGFELFESFYQMEDLVSMVIRCVLAIHLAMQIIMADFYYKKKTFLALMIPVLLHGFFDFAIDYGAAIIAMYAENEQIVLTGVGFLLSQVVISIVMIIYSMGIAKKAGIEALMMQKTNEKQHKY